MAFTIIYSIEDSKGANSTTEINLPSDADFVDVIAFAAAMATLIDDMIEGVIRRIGVAFTVDLPGGLRTTPVIGTDVEEGARFQWVTENGFYTSLRIPTFNEDGVETGSRGVDTLDAAVAPFIAAMITGIDVGDNTPQPCDKREEDITALSTAREQFLSSRRMD